MQKTITKEVTAVFKGSGCNDDKYCPFADYGLQECALYDVPLAFHDNGYPLRCPQCLTDFGTGEEI